MNYPTPTGYKPTGPHRPGHRMSQNHSASGGSNQSAQVQNAKNGQKSAKMVQNAPKSCTFRSLKPKRPRYKMAQMAQNGTVLGNPKQNRQALPGFAMKTAIYCGIAGRTIVMATTGNNAPWSKGLSRQKEHSFLIRFRRRNESSRPTRPPTANSPFNKMRMLTQANCLGLRGPRDPNDANWRRTSVADAQTSGCQTGIPNSTPQV